VLEVLDKKLELGRCGFVHHGPQPLALFVLHFARPCGCVSATVNRPSLACLAHKESWNAQREASVATKCTVCGQWSHVHLIKVERIG
jgi:hypothetical protein